MQWDKFFQGSMFIVFAKCSRGYVYSRGCVYSRVYKYKHNSKDRIREGPFEFSNPNSVLEYHNGITYLTIVKVSTSQFMQVCEPGVQPLWKGTFSFKEIDGATIQWWLFSASGMAAIYIRILQPEFDLFDLAVCTFLNLRIMIIQSGNYYKFFLLIKVSTSRKQFMVSSILPNNERKNSTLLL